MRKLEPRLMALHIGSMPHTDPVHAVQRVLEALPDIPAWPQLPRRSFRENMYVQFSEGFPGVVIEDEKIYVDRARDLTPELERLYTAYIEEDPEFAAISREHALGFYQFIETVATLPQPPAAVKGQVTGPVSWGLTVTDRDGWSVLYDEVLAEALAKHLGMKAAWQERELRKLSPNTIIFLDEPYMASFGSAYVAVGREQAQMLLEEALSAIQGVRGIHCCGNTDWSLLLETPVDILSLDAYGYAEALALYPEEVHAFLDRGGIIAWGIVPTSKDVMQETTASLVDRLHAAMNLLVRKGIPFEKVLSASLITPSCGTGTLSPDLAERVFTLTAEVSAEMRRRYGTE